MLHKFATLALVKRFSVQRYTFRQPLDFFVSNSGVIARSTNQRPPAVSMLL